MAKCGAAGQPGGKEEETGGSGGGEIDSVDAMATRRDRGPTEPTNDDYDDDDSVTLLLLGGEGVGSPSGGDGSDALPREREAGHQQGEDEGGRGSRMGSERVGDQRSTSGRLERGQSLMQIGSTHRSGSVELAQGDPG